MAAEQGLQQLKSARARENICNAAIALLAKVGYAETTIAGVAQAAGFSKGAVQYHFPHQGRTHCGDGRAPPDAYRVQRQSALRKC